MHPRLLKKIWLVVPLMALTGAPFTQAADTGSPAPEGAVTAPPPPLEINLSNPGLSNMQDEGAPEIPVDSAATQDANKNIPATAPPPPAETAPVVPPPPPAEAAAGTPAPAPTPSETPEAAAPTPPPAPAPEAAPPVEAQAPAPAPEPTPEASPAPENVVFAPPRRNPRIPKFQLMRPSWGFQILGSPKALGGHDLISGQNGASTAAVGVQFEYQPKFIQSIGILGLGPSVMIYPISPDAGITSGPVSLWSAGGQVRYQARFFRQQPIVPVAGYEMNYLSYAFNTGAKGNLTASGPFFGVYLFMNLFDPGAAADSFIDNGIQRTYLTAEYHQTQGNNADLAFSGGSYFLGLRFEF